MILTNEIDFQEALEDGIIKGQLGIDYSLIDFYYLSEFDGGGKGTSISAYAELQKAEKDQEFFDSNNAKEVKEI